MGYLHVVAPSCVHSGHLPLGSLSQAGMSLFGWMVPGSSQQPGEGDRGRKMKLQRKWLNVHFERSLLQTRGATRDGDGKRRPRDCFPAVTPIKPLGSPEDLAFEYPCSPRAKHAPISSDYTRLGLLSLD